MSTPRDPPEPGGPDPAIIDEVHREGDAPRRTHLANERTFLAWWRSGLAAVAVGFGIGKFGPALGSVSDEWPFVVLGGAFVVLGVVFMLYGDRRRRAVDRALAQGHRIPSEDGWFLFFTVATAALSLGALAVIVATG